MRLQKYIAQAGVASRRHAEKMIEEGKVKVNGKVIKEMGVVINPEKDKVEVDGKVLSIVTDLKIWAFNKPRNVVTTVSDPFGRPSVLDYFKEVEERIYPVGRLDYASEGLLLLTNDGDLTYHLTHPKTHVAKVYEVWVKGNVTDDMIQKLGNGIVIEGRKTAASKVSVIMVERNKTLLCFVLFEGRNRQIRKMCEAVGLIVHRLKRVTVGNLTLEDLKSGKSRLLTAKEVDKLRHSCGLESAKVLEQPKPTRQFKQLKRPKKF